MMFRLEKTWAATVAVLLFGATTDANEAPELRNNPFARPPSAVTMPFRSDTRTDGPTPALELRATLVGTWNKLANVGGKIVRPGDDVAGYKLVQVFEDRAVFSREGNRLTIYVKPELEDDDEE